MRYTLLLHYPELSPEELGPEGMAEGQRAFTSYAQTLDAAGVLLSAEVLRPSSTTTTPIRSKPDPGPDPRADPRLDPRLDPTLALATRAAR